MVDLNHAVQDFRLIVHAPIDADILRLLSLNEPAASVATTLAGYVCSIYSTLMPFEVSMALTGSQALGEGFRDAGGHGKACSHVVLFEAQRSLNSRGLSQGVSRGLSWSSPTVVFARSVCLDAYLN